MPAQHGGECPPAPSAGSKVVGATTAPRRCFVALWPDAASGERLAALALALRAGFPQARAVDRCQLHLTLAFIGALDAARAQQIAGGLRELTAPPCLWTIDRVDRFEGARVAWAGGPAPAALTDLVRRVEALLEARHVGFDRRPYQPHVTLLRNLPRRCDGLARAVEPAVAWIVRNPVLLQSAGGRYLEVDAGD